VKTTDCWSSSLALELKLDRFPMSELTMRLPFLLLFPREDISCVGSTRPLTSNKLESKSFMRTVRILSLEAVLPLPKEEQLVLLPSPREEQLVLLPSPREEQLVLLPSPREEQLVLPSPREEQPVPLPTPREEQLVPLLTPREEQPVPLLTPSLLLLLLPLLAAVPSLVPKPPEAKLDNKNRSPTPTQNPSLVLNRSLPTM